MSKHYRSKTPLDVKFSTKFRSITVKKNTVVIKIALKDINPVQPFKSIEFEASKKHYQHLPHFRKFGMIAENSKKKWCPKLKLKMWLKTFTFEELQEIDVDRDFWRQCCGFSKKREFETLFHNHALKEWWHFRAMFRKKCYFYFI